eukprot:1777706-Amphidinium_carterae.2
MHVERDCPEVNVGLTELPSLFNWSVQHSSPPESNYLATRDVVLPSPFLHSSGAILARPTVNSTVGCTLPTTPTTGLAQRHRDSTSVIPARHMCDALLSAQPTFDRGTLPQQTQVSHSDPLQRRDNAGNSTTLPRHHSDDTSAGPRSSRSSWRQNRRRAAQEAPLEATLLDHISVVTLNVLSLSEKENGNTMDPLRQTGQLVFLCNRLLSEKIAVAFTQESRLNLPSDFNTSTHIIVQNPSQRGIGGLLILIDKMSGIELLSHRVNGPRILSASVRLRQTVFFLVNAHAPIRRSPPEVHADFATRLRETLSSKPIAATLIGGADLNMRSATMPQDVCIAGPWASHCPHAADHAHSMMRAIQEASIVLANTFLNSASGPQGCPDLDSLQLHDEQVTLTTTQHDTIATWLHPRSKQTFQIDYVLTCPKAFEAITCCRTLPWSHFDLLTTSDHRPVKATFLLQHGTKRKRLDFPTRSHKSDAHLESFKAQIRRKMAAFTSTSDDPLDTTLGLQEIAVETLRATQPRRATPRQEWITARTWQHMRVLHALRKLLKVRRHDTAACDLLLPLTLFPAIGSPEALQLPCS